MTLATLVEGPWRAKLAIDRTPTGWSVSADVEVPDGIDAWHEWWLGLSARGVTRWRASSAAESEHGLADDPPGVGPLWVNGDGPLELTVDLWIALFDDDGGSADRAFRARCVCREPGDVAVVLAPLGSPWAAPRPIAPEVAAPIERIELPVDPLSSASGVLPGVGVLATDRDGWTLTTATGRHPLPSFRPPSTKSVECVTTGPDGRAAVVWSHGDLGWHIHLYTLPDPRPHAVIPPTPRANGNSPHPGVFSPDGTTALLPCGYDQIGLIDHATGAVRHRFPSGGYVAHVALAYDEDRVWIAGHGAARGYDLVTGDVVEEHALPDGGSREPAFDARARRYAWHESFDGDAPLSALGWYDLDGTMGQVLVPDALDEAPVVVDDGSVLVRGRAGLWRIEPATARLQRLTGPLYTHWYARSLLARRDGDQLTVWTTDRAHYQLVYDLR